MNIKIQNILLILLAILLFVIVFYQMSWVDEFGDIDSCCSGLCGRCPPSFWECSFMGFVATIQITIGTILLALGLFDIMGLKEKK